MVEKVLMRFPSGTFARISAVLPQGQSRAEFIRESVNAALARAEGRSETWPALTPWGLLERDSATGEWKTTSGDGELIVKTSKERSE